MKRIVILIVALFFTLALSGCRTGDIEPPVDNEGGKYVSIRINKDKLFTDNNTRYTEEPVGNEEKINSLTFYFFDAGGVKVYEKQLTSSDLSNSTSQPDWNSKGIIRLPENIKPTISNATSLYVVANEILTGVTNKAILLTKQAAGLPQDNMGNFIMEGHYEGSEQFNPNVSPMVTVLLKRMSAKIRLIVTLGEPGNVVESLQEWAPGLRYLLRNQMISGYVIENTSCELSEANHTSDNITYFYEGGITPVHIAGKGGKLPVMEKYTYEHYWSNSYDNQTYLLLQLPYKDSETGAIITQNYYKVTIDKVGVKRNKIYEVSVVVNTIGSSSSDLPVEIQPSYINIIDWINVNIGADVVNDYLYVPSTLFKMYGKDVSFKYKASNQPMVYLTTAKESWDDNVLLPADEASADVSDFSKGEGMAYIYRTQLERFAEEVPRRFYGFFHLRSIVKRIDIEQYPNSYFGKTDAGTDYYHIITPKDTKEYPIGYNISYNPATDEYTTAIHEFANTKVSPDFFIQDKPIMAEGEMLLDNEYSYPKLAENHCVRLQKASGKVWALPTVRQWQLVAEACRILEARGVSSPVPYGNYAVAQRSDTYYGYAVNIPSGEIVNFSYGASGIKTRCVRNAD